MTHSSFKAIAYTLLCIVLPLFISAQGLGLSPGVNQSLYKHLFEINKQWQHYKNTTSDLKKEYSFANDQQRIQKHLQLTTNILRKVNTQKLSDAQLSKRTQHLNKLEEYWKAAQFPINDKHNHRQPYFVDAKQTHCAVAYLMQQDGQHKLIQKINLENNYAYIDELVIQYPTIKIWASANGFTVQELALIQPNYGPAPQNWYTLGNDGGTEGQINVMKTSGSGDLLYMAGDFTAVDGVPANSIIAWDGENWQTVGAGVTGEILAMDATYNKLYIAGNFTLNQDTSYHNIAVWDGENWEGLQQGNMNGSVRTIISKGSILYIGGDFEMVEGQTMPYLARRSTSPVGDTTWHNYAKIDLPGPNNYDYIENAFSVNAPVNNIQAVGNRILISGEFTQTAPDVIDTLVTQIDTDFIAYWQTNNWIAGFTGPFDEVVTTGVDEALLYVGTNSDGPYSASIFNVGIWETRNISRLDTSNTEELVNGFIRHLDKYYIYGNIIGNVTLSTTSYGLTQIGGLFNNDQNAGGGASFDNLVRACEVFQNNLYFAGDFTKVYNNYDGVVPLNGLAYSPMDGLTSTVESQKSNINIYSNSKQLHIKYEDLSNQTQLMVYNLQGQVIESYTLNVGAADLQKDLSHFSDGVYFYQLVDGESRYSGKLAVF